MIDDECPEYESCDGCYVCHPLCPKPQCDSCPKCCPRWDRYFGECLNDRRERRRLQDEQVAAEYERRRRSAHLLATLNRIPRRRGRRG